jgi:CRP/FNR family transcriptional regulator
MLQAVAVVQHARSESFRAPAPVKSASACASCRLRGVCVPCGLDGRELERFGSLVTGGRRVSRGNALYRSGDKFEFLYAVRSGGFKTVSFSRNGTEKITGFQLAGEMLGLEAISSDRHGYDAIAIEDGEVCAIPFSALEKLSLAVPLLQRNLFRIISGDITRDQGLMLLLGGMLAEQRLAAFLLSLSRRYARLGFSSDRFVLRMTREEIGNYLGLALETVSRLLSRFHQTGLISVNQREIELTDAAGLRNLVGN